MEEYDITDYLKDDKELQKAVIEEFLKEIAELEAENERLKEEVRTEKIYSSQIEELEESIVGQRNAYKKLNSQYKENCEYTGKLEQTLQKIKEIVETCMSKVGCFECEYSDDCNIGDVEIPTYDICKLLIQLITKAEEE